MSLRLGDCSISTTRKQVRVINLPVPAPHNIAALFVNGHSLFPLTNNNSKGSMLAGDSGSLAWARVTMALFWGAQTPQIAE